MTGHWWKLLDEKGLLTICGQFFSSTPQENIQHPTTVKYLPPFLLAFSWLCCSFILSGSNSSHLPRRQQWTVDEFLLFPGASNNQKCFIHELWVLCCDVHEDQMHRETSACWTGSHRDWWLRWSDAHLTPACQTKDTTFETFWNHESKQLRKESTMSNIHGPMAKIKPQEPQAAARGLRAKSWAWKSSACGCPLLQQTAVIRKSTLEEGSNKNTPDLYWFVWNQAAPKSSHGFRDYWIAIKWELWARFLFISVQIHIQTVMK